MKKFFSISYKGNKIYPFIATFILLNIIFLASILNSFFPSEKIVAFFEAIAFWGLILIAFLTPFLLLRNIRFHSNDFYYQIHYRGKWREIYMLAACLSLGILTNLGNRTIWVGGFFIPIIIFVFVMNGISLQKHPDISKSTPEAIKPIRKSKK